MKKVSKTGASLVGEIAELKEKFDNLKDETEEFLKFAKKLSDHGLHEAHDLLESGKDNWQKITSAFESSGFSRFFSKGKGAKKRLAKKTGAARKKGASKRR